MKKVLLFLLGGVFLAATAEAAICNANMNKSNSSITACMAKSIAGDVIKLKPGTYTDAANGGNETFPIQMKAGVTLRGYGANNTRIVSTGNAVFEGDSAGVVIEDIAVEAPNRVIYLTAMSTADGILIKDSEFTSTDTSGGWQGVHIFGNTESVTIDGCTFSGVHWVLGVNPQSATPTSTVRIENSTFIDTRDSWGEGAIAPSGIENLIIKDTEIFGWSNEIMQGNATTALFDNMNSDVSKSINIVTETVLMKNSRLGYASTQPSYIGSRGLIRVVNSQLTPPVNYYPAAVELKLLNCYDASGNPIPNL